MLTFAVVTALCLAGLTASARPAPQRVQPLWSARGATENGTLLTQDTVYLQQPTIGGAQVAAYDLATGDRRWSWDMAGSIGYLFPADQAGLLLAPTDQQTVVLPPGSPEPMARQITRETVALDARSGAPRWRAAGEPIQVTRDSAVMAEFGDKGNLRRLLVVRTSDGQVLWSLDTPGIEAQTVAMSGDRPTALITVANDGTATTYRYADGVPTRRVKIPWTHGKPEEGYHNDLFFAGDKVMVNHGSPNGFDLRAYRLDTMTQLWGLTDKTGYFADCGALLTGYFADCGALLCFVGDGLLEAYDYNGKKHWQLPVASSVWAVSTDRLVLDDMGGDDQHSLVDATTGQKIGDSPRGYVVWPNGPTDSLLLTRSANSPKNRTAVVRWDLRTGKSYVVGTIDRAAALECQSMAKYLVCRRGTDTVEVTAVR
jgi:outer membrane protein assembly factor BamB